MAPGGTPVRTTAQHQRQACGGHLHLAPCFPSTRIPGRKPTQRLSHSILNGVGAFDGEFGVEIPRCPGNAATVSFDQATCDLADERGFTHQKVIETHTAMGNDLFEVGVLSLFDQSAFACNRAPCIDLRLVEILKLLLRKTGRLDSERNANPVLPLLGRGD